MGCCCYCCYLGFVVGCWCSWGYDYSNLEIYLYRVWCSFHYNGEGNLYILLIFLYINHHYVFNPKHPNNHTTHSGNYTCYKPYTTSSEKIKLNDYNHKQASFYQLKNEYQDSSKAYAKLNCKDDKKHYFSVLQGYLKGINLLGCRIFRSHLWRFWLVLWSFYGKFYRGWLILLRLLSIALLGRWRIPELRTFRLLLLCRDWFCGSHFEHIFVLLLFLLDKGTVYDSLPVYIFRNLLVHKLLL